MGGFVAPDVNFKQRVRESFQRQSFMGFIGAELLAIEPGYCEVSLPYSPDLTQQHGYFHAGVIASVADNAAGYAAYSLMPPSSSVLTVEYKINLMTPARGDHLIGKAGVERAGRNLTICQSKVYVEQDGDLKLCAVTQSTIMQLINAKDSV